MLTFENDKDGEKLEIHSDIEGLKYLHTVIDSLIKQSEKIGHEHVHLMTEAWGGSNPELTNEKQQPGNVLFNHIKIFCWHEI